MPDTELLGAVDAALIVKRDRATVNRWARSGRLPTHAVVGGARIFKRDDVLALARQVAKDTAARMPDEVPA